MPTQLPDDSEEEYDLSSISVESVGLVSRGAVSLGDEVGKNFFLLKSQEATMDEPELVIEEVTEDESPPVETPDDIPQDTGFLKWFQGLFKARTEKQAESLKLAAKALRDGGYTIDAKKLAGMMDGMGGGMDADEQEPDEDDMMQMGRASSPGKRPGKASSRAKKSMDDTAATIIKAQIEAMQGAWALEREALVKSVQEAADAKYQAEITDLKSRVEKAELEKAGADELREKREFIEKAQTLRALPTPVAEIGDLLFKANKALAPDDYQKLEAVLKASDNLLGAASIFNEFGRASVEEVTLTQKAEQIAKSQGIPFDEAMLTLPEHEQLQLLKEMRGGA